MNNSQKVLIIAPHLDDEVLGCGGTIAKLAAEGNSVYVCFIAHRIYNHKYDKRKMTTELKHAEKAKNVLGYKEYCLLDLHDERLDQCIQDIIIPLEKYVYTLKPEIVYSPFINDNNQDHWAVAKAVQVVLRPLAATFVKRWMIYETPSSTEQTPSPGIMPFSPAGYVNIERYLNQKLKALAEYETESRTYPHPRSPEAIKALAMSRGVEAGIKLAEAFMFARETVH